MGTYFILVHIEIFEGFHSILCSFSVFIGRSSKVGSFVCHVLFTNSYPLSSGSCQTLLAQSPGQNSEVPRMSLRLCVSEPRTCLPSPGTHTSSLPGRPSHFCLCPGSQSKNESRPRRAPQTSGNRDQAPPRKWSHPHCPRFLRHRLGQKIRLLWPFQLDCTWPRNNLAQCWALRQLGCGHH